MSDGGQIAGESSVGPGKAHRARKQLLERAVRYTSVAVSIDAGTAEDGDSQAADNVEPTYVAESGPWQFAELGFDFLSK